MNRISFYSAIALFASMAVGACVASDDGSLITDAGNQPTIDGPVTPIVDAAPQATRMYVHTRDKLYIIDDLNFSLTEVGDFNAENNSSMLDLAITPDGEIYTLSRDALFKVDRNTAQATRIGDVAGDFNVGMTFLIDGTLLATDANGGVRRIDPLTGAVTEIGEFGSGYATAGDLVGVADGRMFAISDQGPAGNEEMNNVLITINPETGAFVESIGQIGFGRVFGSAVANNRIYAFTDEGFVIEINPSNGVGTERAHYQDIAFWGAGVTPRAGIE